MSVVTEFLDVFKSIGKKIAQPFIDLYHGNFLQAMKDALGATPYGLIVDSLNNIVTFDAYITNYGNEDIAVIVKDNADWIDVDLVSDIVQLAVSMGSSPSGYDAIKNAKTFMELFKATSELRSAAAAGSRFFDLFAQNALTIKPFQRVMVNQKSVANPMNYTKPSTWGAIFGASDITYNVVNKKGRTISFNANSAFSWIATENGMQRTMVHDPSIPDKGQGIRAWE